MPQTMKRHSDEPGEGLGTPDSPEMCAKIIRRYATLREEYLNGKSDSDFNSSSTTDQERWLMCEIGGLRKAADLLSCRYIRRSDRAPLAVLGPMAGHGGRDPQWSRREPRPRAWRAASRPCTGPGTEFAGDAVTIRTELRCVRHRRPDPANPRASGALGRRMDTVARRKLLPLVHPRPTTDLGNNAHNRVSEDESCRVTTLDSNGISSTLDHPQRRCRQRCHRNTHAVPTAQNRPQLGGPPVGVRTLRVR